MDLPFDPDQQAEAELARANRLEKLGQTIAEKRDEAVQARQASGIENVWMECEEAYLGIDDENRSEWQNAKWAKPTSMEGPLRAANQGARDDSRSTAYVRLTSRYVDAGAAKMQEILLPIDDKPFSFDPTPIADLIQKMKQAQPAAAVPPQLPGQATPPPPQPGVAGSPPGAPGLSGQPPQPAADIDAQAKVIQDQAKDCAKRAEKRVYDWMVEAKHAREMRKVIHDSARIGVGVLKAPFIEMRKSQAVTKTESGVALEIKYEAKPSEAWIDPWNLFPDGACGENIHDGDHIFERDFMSPKKLRELKRNPTYLPDQIEKVLKEGADKALAEDTGVNPNEAKDGKSKKKRFTLWYYYGTIAKEDLVAAKTPGVEDVEQEELYAILTLVNDSIIRAVINPLDSGEFPYRTMGWQRRAGSWAGVGVAEQVKIPQRMVNAATRAMMNNAGKSAGSQIIMDNESIIPADSSWTITPEKIWHKAPGAIVDDVRKAFLAVQFPNCTPQMMSIIEYAFRLAEESTNIPLITQGQSGTTTPDTLGGMQLQNNNANQLLRSIAYTFDDCITEPTVRAFYEYLLLDPKVPNDEKGDWTINAHGSAALVERAIQDQFLQQMGQMVMNPAFGINPQKWFAEVLAAKHMDARRMEYTAEEKAQLAQQQQPSAPQVQVAQINADAKLKVTEAQIAADKEHALADAQLALHERQIDGVEAEKDRQLSLVVAQSAEHIQAMKTQGASEQTIQTLKTELAETVLKLRVTKELAATDHAVDLHKHNNPQPMPPIVQVPGRAPNDRAFAQV